MFHQVYDVIYFTNYRKHATRDVYDQERKQLEWYEETGGEDGKSKLMRKMSETPESPCVSVWPLGLRDMRRRSQSLLQLQEQGEENDQTVLRMGLVHTSSYHGGESLWPREELNAIKDIYIQRF